MIPDPVQALCGPLDETLRAINAQLDRLEAEKLAPQHDSLLHAVAERLAAGDMALRGALIMLILD